MLYSKNFDAFQDCIAQNAAISKNSKSSKIFWETGVGLSRGDQSGPRNPAISKISETARVAPTENAAISKNSKNSKIFWETGVGLSRGGQSGPRNLAISKISEIAKNAPTENVSIS